MTQRAAVYHLKLLVDDAMRHRSPRNHENAIMRLDDWLDAHPEHRSEYVRYNIGLSRRRWLEAHEGDANGRTGRSIG